MTKTEMEEQIEFLKKQRDKIINPDDKRKFQIQIDYYEDEIRKLNHSQDGRSTLQNVVGGVTRIIAGATSIVVGEVDACVTGRTDEKQVRRRRGKFVDSAETSAVRITKTIEDLINRRK